MKKDTSRSAATTHSPQAPLAAIVLAAIVLLAVIWVGWDLWNRHGASRNCDDGPRYAIDTRQFATEYTAYSLKLEGSLNDKAKGTLTLDPVQQEKLSEALERGMATIPYKMGHLIKGVLPKTSRSILCGLRAAPHVVINNRPG